MFSEINPFQILDFDFIMNNRLSMEEVGIIGTILGNFEFKEFSVDELCSLLPDSRSTIESVLGKMVLRGCCVLSKETNKFHLSKSYFN